LKKIKRTYLHCDLLEEAPMWGSSNASRLDLYTDKACDLFREKDSFLNACRDVLASWPNSSLQNLSSRGSNRKAWLGQAAQYVNNGAVEYETRTAWRLLDDDERDSCNAIAEKVIGEWEKCQRLD